MFDTSLEWLREGVRDLLWHDRELCYSHRLWLQHGQDERRERAWNADGDGIPGGYPSVLAGTFYQSVFFLLFVSIFFHFVASFLIFFKFFLSIQ